MNQYVDENTQNEYSVGPFIRLYKPIGNRVAFFGQGSAYYSFGKSKYESTYPNSTPSTTPYKELGVNLSPGLVFFPTQTLGLEVTLGKAGYYSSKSEPEDSEPFKSRGFDVAFGLSNVSLGISLYLGRTAAE